MQYILNALVNAAARSNEIHDIDYAGHMACVCRSVGIHRITYCGRSLLVRTCGNEELTIFGVSDK